MRRGRGKEREREKKREGERGVRSGRRESVQRLSKVEWESEKQLRIVMVN